MKNDAERIREFNAVLQKYRAGKAAVERRCIAAENWWRLRNSAEERKEAQGLSGFKAESGWLHNVIVSKHADGMDAYPAPCVLPREPGDRQAAETLGKILPAVLEQNGFEQVYSDVLWQKLKTGTGVFKVVWDPDKLNGLGDIAIKRVDLLNIFWEPGVSDIQDSAHVFCTSWEDSEELMQQYPELRGHIGGGSFRPARFNTEEPAAPEGRTLVTEVYYKKSVGGRRVLHYCRYAGDVMLFDSERGAIPLSLPPAAAASSPRGRVETQGGLEAAAATSPKGRGETIPHRPAGGAPFAQGGLEERSAIMPPSDEGGGICEARANDGGREKTTPQARQNKAMKPPAAASGGRSAYDLILPLPIEGRAFNGGPDSPAPLTRGALGAEQAAGESPLRQPSAASSPKGGAGTIPQSAAPTAPFTQGGLEGERIATAAGRLAMTDLGDGGAETDSVRGIYGHGLYPFVFDALFPVEGSPCGYGFIDLCRNPQTQIDLIQTALIRNTLAGAIPRYFRRVDGAVNDREFLDLDRALVTVDGNLGEDSLRPIDYRPLSGNYLEMRQHVIEELRETSGNTETSSGVTQGGVTAASAIAALQEASGKGSRDASRGSYRAFAKVVELCIELIREFYTLPRQFRITGEMGQQRFVSYSNEALCRRSLGSVHGISLGDYEPVFDVRVQPQRQSPYNRLSQNELALQFYQLGFFEPGRAQAALGCLEMMDFEGKEALCRRIGQAAARQHVELLRMQAARRRAKPDGARASAAAAGSAAVPGGEAV